MESYVSFPKLFGGLEIPVNRIAFNLFGRDIAWYGIIIATGVILCVTLAMISCEKHGITRDDLLDYLIVALPSAIVGARLYFVLFRLDEYLANPISILYVWEGGLAIYGGVIAAMLAVFIMSLFKKQKAYKIMNFALPYIALGQAIGRWGNFFNQEAYGCATDLPWGMTGSTISKEVVNELGYEAGTLVHPTFLYESLWCLGIFVLCMCLRRTKFEKNHTEFISAYLVLYGLERMFVEGLRTDSLYIGNSGIRVSQVLSGVLVIAGLVLFIVMRVIDKRHLAESKAPSESALSGARARFDELTSEETKETSREEK